jgi:hypothetical protein
MGAGPVTAAGSGTSVAQRFRSWRGLLLMLAVLCAVAAISTYLTAPRPGGEMDPVSTGPKGAHALVTLLREHGVDVVVADNVADAEKAVGPDTLLLVARTQYLTDDALLHRLAATRGAMLLVEPTSHARAVLAPGIRSGGSSAQDSKPDCALRAADRAGPVEFGPTNTYAPVAGLAATSCYGGALVRYREQMRTVTLVGSAEFMTNGGLSRAGNAALAMNLAGERARLIWYAPQRPEGHSPSSGTIVDLIPDNVSWMIWQLGLAVILVALWKGRRIGPLVAEELPVVVRASETVEGRGRLYRSRRARDRAADALRSATLQRLVPRLGLSADTSPPAVTTTVAQRSGTDPDIVWHALFGPPPATDTDLVHLARMLDHIEREVTHL